MLVINALVLLLFYGYINLLMYTYFEGLKKYISDMLLHELFYVIKTFKTERNEIMKLIN